MARSIPITRFQHKLEELPALAAVRSNVIRSLTLWFTSNATRPRPPVCVPSSIRHIVDPARDTVRARAAKMVAEYQSIVSG